MSKKSKTTSQSTTVQTPNVPTWIQGPYQQYTGQVAGLLGKDPSSFSVGANNNQQAAWQRAGALTGNSAIGEGTQAMRGLLGFTPQSVQAGQLADTDLSRYTSPFQNDVINASMADYDKLLGQTFNSLKAQTPTGAYGGSRQGVAMGQAGADAARQQAGLLANLRQSGFENAQRGAQFDIGNRFAADQFNSNQGLAGANFRAGIGQNLYNMGVGADANERANIGAQGAAGDQQRAIELANNPELQRAVWLSTIGGLLGQSNPSLFTGQTSNTNASSTQKTSDPLGAVMQLAGAAGSVMSGLGMLGVGGGGMAGGLLGKLTPMRDASDLMNLRF